jgi:uncharacterized protein YjbJ (UPF0337 family)
MNKNIAEGKWRQMRGMVKAQWGKLTDDQLDQINGNIDQLAGKLQERYGYSQEEARMEVDNFIARHDNEIR